MEAKKLAALVADWDKAEWASGADPTDTGAIARARQLGDRADAELTAADEATLRAAAQEAGAMQRRHELDERGAHARRARIAIEAELRSRRGA